MNLVCPDKMDKTREDDWCVEVARIIAKRKERLAGCRGAMSAARGPNAL